MSDLSPSKVFKQLGEESKRVNEAAEEAAQRDREKWAAYDRRQRALQRLADLLPLDSSASAADVPLMTDLMIEYARTLSPSRAASLRKCWSKRTEDEKVEQSNDLEDVLLELLANANAGDQAKVAEVFREVVDAELDVGIRFRWLLVNWLADQVVDGLPRLSDQQGGKLPDSVEDDLSAYVPVKQLWQHRLEFKRDSDMTKFLDKVPNEPAPTGIRNYRKGQRRFVHAADWLRYFAEKDRKASEALDSKAAQAFLADTAARQAQERERNRGK